MKISRFSLILLMICVLLVGVGIQAQEELQGEITLSFWGNVAEYESRTSANLPWQATFDLIQEWAAQHPNVTINWVSQPTDGIYNRLRTQLINGTLPDLVAAYADADMLSGNLDLLYNLADDMSQPNPYGSMQTWAEEFWVDDLRVSGWAAPGMEEGAVYVVGNTSTTNLGQVVVYYNKHAFADAGVTAIPETFDQLLDACDALKANGQAAYFADATSGPSIHWLMVDLSEQLRDPIIRSIEDAWGVADGFQVLTEEMHAWAITNDVLRGDSPYVTEVARLIKEMSQRCWNEDWTAPEATVNYFLNGRTAMIQQGFWTLRPYTDDPARDFEFGSFVLPLVTQESSEYATSATVRRWGGLEGGEIGNAFFIPQTTVDKGTLPIVLDLLQFLTARPTNDQWCEVQWPPCIRPGESVSDIVTDPVVQDQVYGFFNPVMSVDTANRGMNHGPDPDTFRRLLDLYMADAITIEEFGAQLQDAYVRWAEMAITTHPEWNMDAWPEA